VSIGVASAACWRSFANRCATGVPTGATTRPITRNAMRKSRRRERRQAAMRPIWGTVPALDREDVQTPHPLSRASQPSLAGDRGGRRASVRVPLLPHPPRRGSTALRAKYEVPRRRWQHRLRMSGWCVRVRPRLQQASVAVDRPSPAACPGRNESELRGRLSPSPAFADSGGRGAVADPPRPR
jgi:hypothetical protein